MILSDFRCFSTQITSQNPYAEVFVGKPFVQTVDIRNLTEVEEALREITNTKVGNFSHKQLFQLTLLDTSQDYDKL